MKKGILVAILVVLLAGTCALSAWIGVETAGRLADSGIPFRLGDVNLAARTAEEVEEAAFAVGTPAALVVENPTGSVRITGGEGDEIQVTARKKAWGRSEAAAQENLEAISVRMEQEGDTLTVTVEGPQGAPAPLLPRLPLPGPAGRDEPGFQMPWVPAARLAATVPYRVDLEISLPRPANVNVSSRFGSIVLSSLEGDARVEGGFGDILVDGLADGSLWAGSTNGRVELRNIDAGTVAVEAHSEFGEVILQGVEAGTVTARTQNGAVRLTDVEVDGPVRLHSQFGAVSFHGGKAGVLQAGTTNGRVSVEGVSVEGDLSVESSFGDVAVKGVDAATYSLVTRNGRIALQGARGQVKARSDFGDIQVLDSEGTGVDLENRNGSVTFRGSLGEGPHRFKSTFGDIRLALPADSALDVDLQTRFGSVRTAFAVTATGEVDEDHIAGSVNGGGEGLSASTENGNINLNLLEAKES